MNICSFRHYLSTLDRRRIFLFSFAGSVLVLLFIPFSWRMPLPGEVRYAREDRLIARENGYIVKSPAEGSHFFRSGELIFILDDPFLRFARERVEYMLNFDRLLFEQQRISRESLGESLLTARKIDSDLHAARELERKMTEARKTADRDLIFIPVQEKFSGGSFVRSGNLLGKLCSGDKIVRAYADDQQIRSLKNGMSVKLLVKDRLTGITGKISAVYHIPVFLRESPALQNYGGDIPVDLDPEVPGEVRSLVPVYAVDVVPDHALPWQTGRFVRAEVQQYVMPAAKIWSLIVSAFKREIL